MKEQAQEKSSQHPGTESCAATGQPARRSVDREVTGRNRKVKEWGPERVRRGRQGYLVEPQAPGRRATRRVRRPPTGNEDHGKGPKDSCRNLGGPTASPQTPGQETPVNKLPATGARGGVPDAPRNAPSARVGAGEDNRSRPDGRTGVSLAHSTEEVG